MNIVYRGDDGRIHSLGENNEIRHWKYIKKIPVGKGFRYFYSWDEYRAYLADPAAELQNAGQKAANQLQSAGRRAAQEARKWVKEQFSKKEEKKKKKQDEEKRQRDPYEKYKYVKKIEINGKTRYFYSQDELNAYNKRSKYQENEPSYLKKLKHSEEPYTRQEDALMVNPNFDWHDSDDRYEYNCAECTAIYELRRRGYDVESNGTSGKSNDDSMFGRLKGFHDIYKYNSELRFKTYYEGAKTQRTPRTTSDEETYKAIISEIDKNPPGSRGDLTVSWKKGGAHSMVWEKDSKGNIRVIDSQSSGGGGYREYDRDGIKGLASEVDNSDRIAMARASVTRTDNLRLKKGITEICQDSKSKPRFSSSSDAPYKDNPNSFGSYNPQKNNEKALVTEYPVLMEDYNRRHAKSRKKSKDQITVTTMISNSN